MKIFLSLIIILDSLLTFSQVIIYEKDRPGKYHELKINDLFKSEFDSVFPGVKIIKRIGLEQGYSPISFVLNNDTTSYLMGYPKVLLDCALLDDSIFRYSEEAAIKTYIYLNHMQYQKYPFSEINYIKILKKDTSFLDNNESRKEQEILDFNYIVDIIVDTTLNADRNLNSSKKLRYFLNTEKGIIKYYCIQVISDKVKYRTHKLKVSQGSLKWKVIEEKYNWQRKKKDKNILGIWENIELISTSHPEEQIKHSYPDGGGCYAMTTVSNGITIPVAGLFKITEIDPSHPNAVLKIFRSSNFGGERTLIWESQINPPGITENEFAPGSESEDGFCDMEIWDGNTCLKEFTPCITLVLLKRKINNSYGRYLHLYYANQFFDANVSIETYIDNLILYYNSTWQHQILDYNFNNGNPPNNSGANYYRLNVNPTTITSNQLYRYSCNNYYYDCYEGGYSNIRIMGITSKPDLFQSKIGILYTSWEDFLKTGISHEFFHGLQVTLNPNITNYLETGSRWIVEGQARAMQTIEYPEIEYANLDGFYHYNANSYLYLSYYFYPLTQQDYDYCLYWRFLFENYSTNPSIASKLAIFRETLLNYDETTVEQMATHMDSKLNTEMYPDFASTVKELHYNMLLNDDEYNLWHPAVGDVFYSHPSPIYPFEHSTISPFDCHNQIKYSYGAFYYRVNVQDAGKWNLKFNGGTGACADFIIQLVPINNPSIRQVKHTTSGQCSISFETTAANEVFYIIITRKDKKDLLYNGIFRIWIAPVNDPTLFEVDYSIYTANKSTTYCQYIDETTLGNETIQSYAWTFPGGDPEISTEQNPQVEYTESDVYSSSLTVTTVSGKQDTKTRMNYVTVYDDPIQPVLDISGYCPTFANPNEDVLFSLYINDGVGPFTIYITFGDGSVSYYQGHFEGLYLNVLHKFNESGIYDVEFIVFEEDGSGGISGHQGSFQTDITIGLPGSQSVNFSYLWDIPGQHGTGWVQLTDHTSGGYRPYLQWEWIYGTGLKTGSEVLNTAGYPWEIIINGDQPKKIFFSEYDTYPVTLIVTDNAGFQVAQTQYIEVSPAIKCLILNPKLLKPYNKNLDKHIMRKEAGDYFAYIGSFGDYFPQSSENSYYCKINYPYSSQYYGSYENVITTVRYKLTKNGILYEDKYENMSDVYVNLAPSPSYDYWENWFYSHQCGSDYHFPHAFCENFDDYNFTETGKYNLLVEYWNFHDVLSPCPLYDNNYSMYNHFNISVYCVDCDEDFHENTPLLTDNYPEGFLAGNIYIADYNNVTIKSPKISYEACNEIIMKAGLTISPTNYPEDHSKFLATITQFEELPTLIQSIPTNNTTIPPNTDITCFPNPNKGSFSIAGLENVKRFEIYNSLGVPVSFNQINSGEYIQILLNNPANNIYFVKAITNDGNIILRKIIVIKD